MIELGVNIDHVATLRQARRADEPDPVQAAGEAELGGADGITVHLREDRRHIQDRDVELLRRTVKTKLNLEMSLSPEVAAIAVRIRPDQATLVPENRQEVTTEGGLDLLAHAVRSAAVLEQLRSARIVVSAFIDPDPAQVTRAAELGFDAIELHTGSYANAAEPERDAELDRLRRASEIAVKLGLCLHAGHGLNYLNTPAVAAIPGMAELNIGHAVVSRAVFVGLREAVRQMKSVIASPIG